MKKGWIIEEKPQKKKLEIELFRYGDTTLIGKILSQDEKLRGAGVIVDTEESFRIESSTCPEIGHDVLYIWGEDITQDNTALVKLFTRKGDLDKYVHRLRNALDKLNGELYTKTDVREVFTRIL